MTQDMFLYGLRITAIGMGIVFATLYLIQLIIIGLGYLVGAVTKKDKNLAIVHTGVASVTTVASSENIGETGTSPQVLNLNIIVAISAAIVADMGSRPINIINIRKNNSPGNAWKQAARLGAAEYHRNSKGIDFYGNYLLMHAMGPNVAGVIGSAIAAGIFLSILN